MEVILAKKDVRSQDPTVAAIKPDPVENLIDLVARYIAQEWIRAHSDQAKKKQGKQKKIARRY